MGDRLFIYGTCKKSRKQYHINLEYSAYMDWIEGGPLPELSEEERTFLLTGVYDVERD